MVVDSPTDWKAEALRLQDELRRHQNLNLLYQEALNDTDFAREKMKLRRDRWRERYEAKAAELTGALDLAGNAYSTASHQRCTKDDVKDALLPLMKKLWFTNHESQLERRIWEQRREIARLHEEIKRLKAGPPLEVNCNPDQFTVMDLKFEVVE